MLDNRVGDRRRGRPRYSYMQAVQESWGSRVGLTTRRAIGVWIVLAALVNFDLNRFMRRKRLGFGTLESGISRLCGHPEGP